MKVSIERTLIAGIIAAIAGVLAIVLISIRQSGRLQDSGTIIRHTNQVIYQAQEIGGLSARYELSVKNFLLTGDSSFLDAPEASPRLLEQKLSDLKKLTADNARQQERIDSLLLCVDRNRQLLGDATRVGKGRDFQGAAQLVARGDVPDCSRRIATLINQVVEAETRLLMQRRKTSRGVASGLEGVLWALIAAVVVLAGVIFQKVRVDLRKEKKSKEQLSRFNQELAEQVRIQTGALAESESKYKSLFYKSPLPKWIYDQDTLLFLEVNEAAILHYGYSQDDFRRMKITDIRPPGDELELEKDLEDVSAGPDLTRQDIRRHIKKDGTVIFVEVTAHSVEYEQRKARMVVANDITDHKRSEGMLEQLNEALKKRAAELALSNAELERFAYIASHDLQEPLRMVSSFLQLLQKRYQGQLDEKAVQYIHYAVDGAERMKALILDLLEYSRVGSGKETFGPVDMGEVMAEVGETFREKIIAVRARIEIDNLPVIDGDKVQMVQLLQNLIGNALKYRSEDPPIIKIQGYDQPGYWKFSVHDNGIGIDPLFFEKIFVIFQRLHNKNDYSGTGIGLAICKKIVERHWGRIWVESVPAKGSVFHFTITKPL